jgi:acetyl-CoA carboxylase alpha subunit
VIAPETAAAILHRDLNGAEEAADALKLGSAALVELGIAGGIANSNSTRAAQFSAE